MLTMFLAGVVGSFTGYLAVYGGCVLALKRRERKNRARVEGLIKKFFAATEAAGVAEPRPNAN